jgi:type I restriction enzyme S subunit
VPELIISNPPTAQKVPDEQIILRYRNAISKKYNDRYFKHLESGIISKEDFYIIAINGCQIPSAGAEIDLPRIVRSVLPFGCPQFTYDKDSGQIVPRGFQYRAQISKTRGSPVRTDIFLDPYYEHISAILFSNVDVFNLRDDFIIVHNPLARPLPDDFLNFGQQWKAELQGNEVRVSPKS